MLLMSFLWSLWTYAAIIYSQPDLSFPDNIEPDLSPYFTFDPTLFSDEPTIGDTNSNDMMTELNPNFFPAPNTEPYEMTQLAPNLFLDDDAGLDPIVEADPSSFVADSILCDADTANDVQLFGKIRRRDSCSPFVVGQIVPGAGSTKDGQFDLERIFQYLQRPIPVFEPSPEICPGRTFGISNTPVCDVPGVTKVAVTPGLTGSSLDNVYSGVLVYDL